jgi:hypothetical protein
MKKITHNPPPSAPGFIYLEDEALLENETNNLVKNKNRMLYRNQIENYHG